MSSTQQPTSKKRSLESTSSDSILSIALASKTPKFDLGAYLDENKYKGITPTFARFVLEERFRKSLVAGNSGADYSCLPMHIILYILEFHRLEIDEINGKVKHRLIGRHRNDNTRHMVLVFTNLAFTGQPPFIVHDDEDEESDPLLTMSFSDPVPKNPWWLYFIFQNVRHMKFNGIYDFKKWQDYWTHFQYKFQQLRNLSLHRPEGYLAFEPKNPTQILHDAFSTFGNKLRDIRIKTIENQVVCPFTSLRSCSESIYRGLTADCQKTVRHLVIQKNFDLPENLDHITQLSIDCMSPRDVTSTEQVGKVLRSMTNLKRLYADRYANRFWVKNMLENISSGIEHLSVYIRDHSLYEEYFDTLKRFDKLRSIKLAIYYESHSCKIANAMNEYIQWLIEHSVSVCFVALDQSGRGYGDNLVKILRQLNDAGLLSEFRSYQYWSHEMLEEAGFGLPTCNVVSASVLQRAENWVADDLIPLLKCAKIRDITIRAKVQMVMYFLDMLWKTTLRSDFPHIDFSVIHQRN